MQKNLKTVNTILYCKAWQETVRFYRDRLQLPVHFSADWFIEFRLTDSARLSLADEKRSSIKSAAGRGLTIALEVDDIETAHLFAEQTRLNPTTIRKHPWNARVFYFFDPEGHRLEIWQNSPSMETPDRDLNRN